MTQKQIYQYSTAKKGIMLLGEEAAAASSYEELTQILKVLLKYTKEANDKNNRPNKEIIALKNYYENEKGKERSLNKIEKKTKSKKISSANKKIKKTYKDFYFDYSILKNEKGWSYQKIADNSKKLFGVEVSKTSLINLFNKHKEEKENVGE
jgi:hypothetical protein